MDDKDIKEFIHSFASGLDLSEFRGDIVAVKNVENEIGNVEPGGIGVQNLNYYGAVHKNPGADNTKNKQTRTDCCFLYANKEDFAMAIQEFTCQLKRHKLIPQETDYMQMESLFSGRSCRRKYTWLGERHILTHVIKGLCQGSNPILTTWPEGTSKWDVVSCRFMDGDGNPLPNIRQESVRKGTRTIVEELVRAFAAYRK